MHLICLIYFIGQNSFVKKVQYYLNETEPIATLYIYVYI